MSQDAYNKTSFQFVMRPLMKADFFLVNIFHTHQLLSFQSHEQLFYLCINKMSRHWRAHLKIHCYNIYTLSRSRAALCATVFWNIAQSDYYTSLEDLLCKHLLGVCFMALWTFKRFFCSINRISKYSPILHRPRKDRIFIPFL